MCQAPGYEIKYDESRLSLSQIGIIEEYVKLLRSRSKHPENIKLKPHSSFRGSKESLIAVYCAGGGFEGEGHVSVSLEEGSYKDYLLRITGMLNIALASSNIPNDLSEEDAHKYLPIISFIRNQYKAMLNIDLVIPDSHIKMLKLIKNIVLHLPRSMAMDIDAIEEYNRLATEALTAA